jgi:F-type H+-transporting ATPase subunit b
MTTTGGKISWPPLWALVLFMGLWGAAEALGADTQGDWRPTYDVVMRWVNFAIIVVVIVKYGRAPLRNFLTGKKEEISREINRLEDQKTQTMAKIEANQQQLAESRQRLAQLEARIAQDGERNKAQIIAAAHQESDIMIQSAKRKIEAQIGHARQTLQTEIVDVAISEALKQLPEQMTEKDNQKLIDAYIAHTVKL